MSDDKKITVPRAAATADEGQSYVTNNVSIAEESPNRNRKVKGPSRMLSEAIITSGRFLKLSDKAKVLYMYLMVRTDDEGVVEAYPAMMFAGAQENALDELIGKRFVIRLNEDDVVRITHFFEQNTLRADRIKPSRFHDLIADSCPQTAADCQPNINQSNPIKPNIREVNTTQSKSVQGNKTGDNGDAKEYVVFNPKEEYVIPYVMERFGYKYGFSEGDIRLLVELADMLEGISRETDHDPDGSGYEWMQDYFSILFRKLEREISNKEIRDPYAYLKAMIENELRAEGKMSEGHNNTRKVG